MKFICDEGRHLVCLPYSTENLHKMAEELSIKRHWFHKTKSGLYHYDIPAKRIDEIKSKCDIVSTREIVKIIKESEEYKQKNIIFVKT